MYSVKVIDEAGNTKIIKLAQEEGITTIRVLTNPTEYYGKEITNYTCTNSDGVNAWKIFYADKSNIYLISANYIHYDYCPPSVTQVITKMNENYCLSMRNVIEDYSGSSNITDAKIKALNSDYFNKGYTSTYNNMKAVAYMLDTNIWNVFAGEKAEYAIGGPTVEILMKSYSQKYNVDYRARAINNIGYQISNDGGTNRSTSYNGILDTSDSLYIVNTGSNNYMWIASPSTSSDNVMSVYKGGGIFSQSYREFDTGFRPLVCLKSDVELEENSDGTYSIK